MPFLREYLNVRRERKQGVQASPVAPLKLRPGAFVRLNETPFLLLSDDARAAFPGEELIVTGVSETHIDGVPVTRALLRRVGTTRDDILLQVAKDGDGGGIFPTLFTRFDTVVPATPSGWSNWLDEGGILGSSSFMIPADEDPAGHPATIYRRAIWPDTDEWVVPATFQEDMKSASSSSSRHVESMLFYRTLDESAALPYIHAAADNLSIAVSLLSDQASKESLERVATSLRESVAEMTPKPEDTTQEYLLVEFVDAASGDSREITIWVGIEIAPLHFQTI